MKINLFKAVAYCLFVKRSKKAIIKSTVFCLFLLLFFSSRAESAKIIVLNDGSKIKGEIVSFQDGVYRIKTSFGLIKVSDSNIANIASEGQSFGLEKRQQANPQVNYYKQQVLGDPALMVGIEDMTQDSEIMKLLSDQNLLDEIMSQDFQKLQNNPKFRSLINNPKMKKLMNEVGQKIGTHTSPQ